MTVIAFPRINTRAQGLQSEAAPGPMLRNPDDRMAASSVQDGADAMGSSFRDRLLAALLLIVMGSCCIYAFTRIVPLVIAHGQIAASTPDGAAAH